MIDLSALKSIEVDPGRAVVRAQPGVLLGELDRATQRFSMAVPNGTVSETGMAGLTLGGGLGWLSGKYGLTCTNLIRAEVVTADGRKLVASEEENPDLLWGCVGAAATSGLSPISGSALVCLVSCTEGCSCTPPARLTK